MKIISRLPQKTNYLEQPRNGKWFIWQDKDTDRVQLYSEIPNPFEKKVCILFSIKYKKTDNSEYAYGLVLKVFPVDETNKNEPEAFLKRESYKAEFSCSKRLLTKVNQWFAFVNLEKKIITDYWF